MRRFVAASAGLAVGLVLTFMLATATRPTAAPEVSAPSDEQPLAAAAAQQAAPPSSGVPSEGIKVHGHWVIQVRDPDGTLVSRVEFDNALVGGARLANVLARAKSVGNWLVLLHAGAPATTTATGPCGGASAIFDGVCFITETGGGLGTSSPQLFENLTASASAATLRLSGSAIAATDATVGFVATSMSDCAPTTAPSTPCAFGTAAVFDFITAKSLTPISVATGQQIQVTVDISFQ